MPAREHRLNRQLPTIGGSPSPRVAGSRPTRPFDGLSTLEQGFCATNTNHSEGLWSETRPEDAHYRLVVELRVALRGPGVRVCQRALHALERGSRSQRRRGGAVLRSFVHADAHPDRLAGAVPFLAQGVRDPALLPIADGEVQEQGDAALDPLLGCDLIGCASAATRVAARGRTGRTVRDLRAARGGPSASKWVTRRRARRSSSVSASQ